MEATTEGSIVTVRMVKLHYWFVDRLPRWVIYWCAMRLWVAGPPEITLDKAIRRWEKDE